MRPRPVALIAVAGLALAPLVAAETATVLTLAGRSVTRTLTIAELEKMPATVGMGGVKSSTGKVTLPVRWRGVALRDLVAAVGGIGPGQNLVATAKDGYRITFSHEQVVRGAFVAYDPGTGDTLVAHEPLTAILTWERNGRPLDPVADGPLRLAIVSPKASEVTDGHWSAKWVQKIELVPAREAWTLKLRGARAEVVDRSSFESCSAPGCHGAAWIDDAGRTWSGVPLWLLAGRVDDGVRHGAHAFDDSLALEGYDVTVIGAHGAHVTLSSGLLRRNAGVLIADQVEGRPLRDPDFPLRLVGASVESEERIGRVSTIEVRVPGAPAGGGR